MGLFLLLWICFRPHSHHYLNIETTVNRLAAKPHYEKFHSRLSPDTLTSCINGHCISVLQSQFLTRDNPFSVSKDVARFVIFLILRHKKKKKYYNTLIFQNVRYKPRHDLYIIYTIIYRVIEQERLPPLFSP